MYGSTSAPATQRTQAATVRTPIIEPTEEPTPIPKLNQPHPPPPDDTDTSLCGNGEIDAEGDDQCDVAAPSPHAPCVARKGDLASCAGCRCFIPSGPASTPNPCVVLVVSGVTSDGSFYSAVVQTLTRALPPQGDSFANLSRIDLGGTGDAKEFTGLHRNAGEHRSPLGLWRSFVKVPTC